MKFTEEQKRVHNENIDYCTEEEFKELIAELTDKQFWEYVATWKDSSALCEQMLEWDIKTKEYEIKKIKDMFKIK